MPEKLIVLDAHSLIYQVFHAVDEMTAPDGMPTNAVFGFTRDLLNIRRVRKPDYFVAAFDMGDITFRHELSADYKANRKEMPDDLRPQIPLIREVLAAMNIATLGQPGLEADDFLATIACACTERKINCFLCTADKDVRQVISPYVSILDLRRNRIIDADYLMTDWGVRPDQVVDYQALVGDSVDNVPGVPGVGAKTATKLLQQFGTLDKILDSVDQIAGAKLKENIAKSRAIALHCRELVRLKCDAPLPEDWSAWRPQSPDYAKLEELFKRLGFHRMLDEIRAETPAAAAVKPASAPSEWVADYRLVADEASFDAFLKELQQQSRISFDLETTNLNPVEAAIVGYAFCWQAGVAYYVAVRGPEGETTLDPDKVVAALKPILEDPTVAKVGQNLKYDMIVLRAAGVLMQGLAFDSMVGSYLLEPGERVHNLDDLALRQLGHTNIKITELIGKGGREGPQKTMDQVPVADVARYAGEDADVAWRLCDLIEAEVARVGLKPLFDELEGPLIDVLAEMEFHGIRVDPAFLNNLGTEFGGRIETIRAEALAIAGKEFNLDSPKQLAEVLFTELKLPVVKRTKTGPSTDQEVLEELSDKHPLCAKIVDYRQLTKLKGTYVDALPLLVGPRTGRIHCSFNQTVAATGRLSSSDPNLQNIPIGSVEGRKIRQAFLPAEGHVLLSADYSQIELRFLAHYSGDAALRQAFADDVDIHTAVAASIANVPLDLVTPELRRRAKAVNFGIMYGLSPFGLARQLKISQDEAADFIDAYFARYRGIPDFFTSVLEFARDNRYVETIRGRRRAISGIKNTHGFVRNLPERTAINTVIQGSAADLIKIAMLNLHRRMKREFLSAKMLLQIHDELVFEVPQDDVRTFAAIVEDEMTNALELDGVPLKVEVGAGPNWLDTEPLKASGAV